jgi:hypothetical protein
MGANTDRVFGEALRSAEPMWELRGVVRGLLAQGYNRDELLEDLTRLHFDLRAAGREDDEDVVLEVMDFLVGWSSTQMKL